jgi:two-component system, NarL family, invasion response regulator UvrY
MLTIRVGIVDDHAVVRSGLKGLLEMQSDIVVVGEAANAPQALDLVRNTAIDVLLMDLSLPGQSGIDVLASLLARAPTLAVLIVSSYPEAHYAVSLIKQGAMGYLNKQCEPEEIVTAVRKLATGSRYITSNVAELLAQQLGKSPNAKPHETLSEREFQVFLRLAKGETVTDIGEALSLSAKTVSTYRSRIMEKMALATNSDLTYYALKSGLLD